MKLKVDKIPESDVKLIPVANECLNGQYAANIEEIHSDGSLYSVLDKHTFFKDGETRTPDIFMVAFGKVVEWADIWKKYKNSDRVYLFVCKPL